jgi:K+-sensing histidine kinase KdpD
VSISAGDGLRLVAEGPEPFAEDRQLLTRLATTAARAWEGQQLAGEAGQARELAEIDRLRAALLAAVGHDLRTPLASIKAAVSSLRQNDVRWTADEQAEFLATIEDSADRLDDLIANLLAMSRLQAGALSVAPRPVGLDEIVAKALIGINRLEVVVDVPDNLPLAIADPGLLERVVANLIINARRFSPRASLSVSRPTATMGTYASGSSTQAPAFPRRIISRFFPRFSGLEIGPPEVWALDLPSRADSQRRWMERSARRQLPAEASP